MVVHKNLNISGATVFFVKKIHTGEDKKYAPKEKIIGEIKQIVCKIRCLLVL